MKFDLSKSIEILERTPKVLNALLENISDEWALADEEKDTFSPFDIVGHLIHGEKSDWMQRMEIILSEQVNRTFTPYDRFAQYKESEGKSLSDLLAEFANVRAKNIEILKSKNLTSSDLVKTGIHPVFGTVSLQNLLATWTAHDLSHIAQIARVMAKQYKYEIGKWIEYLPIMTR